MSVIRVSNLIKSLVLHVHRNR